MGVFKISAGRREKFFEKLLGSDVKAELLIFFHNEPSFHGTLKDLALRLKRRPEEVRKGVEEFVRLGLLNEEKYYSFNPSKDSELQNALLRELSEERPAEAVEAVKEKEVTNVEVLDRLLPDGLSFPALILILADPAAGKEILALQLLFEGMKKGKSGVYVTLDRFPNEVRELALELGYDPHAYEKENRLLFIDCYSPQVGAKSEERHSEDPLNFPNLSILISRVLREAGSPLMIFDSLSTLFQKGGVRSSLEFLRSLGGKTKEVEGVCFVTLNRKAFHPAILAASEEIADGVVEMKVEEGEEGLVNSLRVSKMVRRRYVSSWTPYEIDVRRGILPKT